MYLRSLAIYDRKLASILAGLQKGLIAYSNAIIFQLMADFLRHTADPGWPSLQTWEPLNKSGRIKLRFKIIKIKAWSARNSCSIAKFHNAGIDDFGLKSIGHDLFRGPLLKGLNLHINSAEIRSIFLFRRLVLILSLVCQLVSD
jgi:hypothetical protein